MRVAKGACAVLALAALSGCSDAPVSVDDAGADAGFDVTLLPDATPLADARVDAADAAAEAAPVDAGVDAGPHVCGVNTPKDCSPGSGTGDVDQCFNGPSCYVSNVVKAVQAVIAAHPTWFDYNNQWTCPSILDVNSYMDAVAAHLVGQGVCAIRDPNAPGEEVTVKHDNVFSENFDIVASNGCARYGTAIYTGWCAPAWW